MCKVYLSLDELLYASNVPFSGYQLERTVEIKKYHYLTKELSYSVDFSTHAILISDDRPSRKLS